MAADATRGTPRSSMEDLSEYTDASESLSSAPTECLAEFLSALMMKDYPAALRHCKLILRYEPHNTTAKDFYPLIEEKIQLMRAADATSSSSGGSSVDDNGNGVLASNSNNASSSAASSSSSSGSSSESDSEGTTASYSSLEDDEAASGCSGAERSDDNGNPSRPAALCSASQAASPSHSVPQGSDSESPTEPAAAAPPPPPPARARTSRCARC